MTQPHALIEALIASGVDLVTGSPGSEWVGVLDALAAARAENPKAPRYVNCRHETLAVGIAYGYARFTGQVPAVLLHSAVGPLHSAMAIRAAYHGKAPLLLLCGDAVTSDVEGVDGTVGGWIWLSRLADRQSSATVAGDYVKWNTQATTVAALVDAVSRGCSIARELPQGPAFVGVPCSLLLGEMPVTAAAPTPYSVPPTDVPDLSEVAATLAGARQPVIINEYAGRTKASVDALVEITESLGAAVYDGVDPLEVNFPWDHPHYQGLRPDAKLATADVILCAGVTTPWFPPGAHVSAETRVIMIDDDVNKTRLPYWNYRIQSRLPGNIERNLTALAAAWGSASVTPSGPSWRSRHGRWYSSSGTAPSPTTRCWRAWGPAVNTTCRCSTSCSITAATRRSGALTGATGLTAGRSVTANSPAQISRHSRITRRWRQALTPAATGSANRRKQRRR